MEFIIPIWWKNVLYKQNLFSITFYSWINKLNTYITTTIRQNKVWFFYNIFSHWATNSFELTNLIKKNLSFEVWLLSLGVYCPNTYHFLSIKNFDILAINNFAISIKIDRFLHNTRSTIYSLIPSEFKS